MKLHVGTSGFAYKEWKGSFYPKDLSDKRMLHYYGTQLGAVEINNTHYRFPKFTMLENWAAEVPADFKFVIKAHKRITHLKRLKEVNDTVRDLFDVTAILKKRIGPVLFQLPGNFKKDLPRLQDFLLLLPSDRQSTFEFRHQSWFDDEVFEALRVHNVALCIAEAEEGVEVPFVSTADWGYLRLRRLDYRDAELKDWLKRVQSQTWHETYIFFKHEDAGVGPDMAKRLLELAAH